MDALGSNEFFFGKKLTKSLKPFIVQYFFPASKKTSNTESESKRSKLESTKPPMEPPAPKKPKPSSSQMAPILETESDIQNKKSKSTKPPILEQPTSDLVVALIIDELIKQIFDKRAESGM